MGYVRSKRRVRMLRPRWQFASVLAALLLLSSWTHVAVAAQNTDCFGDENYFYDGGRALQTQGAAGAEAKINTVTPLICTGNPNVTRGSVSWVAVTGPGNLDIVQVGTGRCVSVHVVSSGCTDQYQTMWAWGRSKGDAGCPSQLEDALPTWRKIGNAASGVHTYTVLKTPNDWDVKIDGLVKDSAPLSAVCWTPNEVMYLGETWDRGDQMGGTSASKQHFTSAIFEQTVNGPWLSPAISTCVPAYAAYKCSHINGQTLDIWTSR